MGKISAPQAHVLMLLVDNWRFGMRGPNAVMFLTNGERRYTVRPQVSAALRSRGLIEAFGMTITDEGRTALADWMRKEQSV